ncbi:MAG: BatA domain-containing protein, partial [Alphaproteobacteria bacterium]|nr:BatA domain-containing protein [Alphaproteobacteria bacterium]
MIGTAFGALTFLNPWILSGLIFLPALWFLLRVTPPAPHLMYFPPAHILAGLTPQERTPSRTPWWVLLLRLIMAALVIMALAGPVLNPGTTLPGAGGIRIVMDNSWPGAQTWSLQTAEASALLKRAGRENREVHIMTTAPEPGKTTPLLQGPLTVAQAESLLRGLTPQPWPADYSAMATALQGFDPRGSIHSFWLGHGLSEGKHDDAVKALQAQGGLSYMHPSDNMLPLLLRPHVDPANNLLTARLDAPAQLSGGVPATVQAVGGDGRLLDSVSVTLDPGTLPMTVSFDMPETLRAQVAMIRVSGRESAGTVLLTDDRFRNRAVGLVTPENLEETAPLIEASYYIRRALETSAQVQTGEIETLIDSPVSVIILPDVGAIPPGTLDALEQWVRKGGLLLRFAGPNMTQGEQFLTPVPLRGGNRALDGALTWEQPVKLAPFPEASPFFGLPITEDITVKRQIL